MTADLITCRCGLTIIPCTICATINDGGSGYVHQGVTSGRWADHLCDDDEPARPAEATAAEPIGGRSEPHPSAAPDCALTWRPEIDRTDHDAAYWAALLVVECEPCGWRRTLTGTYTTGQLDRLDVMHCGGAA